MAIDITMPALSPTMEKGTLAKWLVGVGDRVMPGDLLAEIETDKATMEFEAVDEGRIAELLVAEGTDDVVVGTPIARLLTGEVEAPKPVFVPPSASAQVAQAAADPATVAELPHQSYPAATELQQSDDNRLATPLARRLAAAWGLNLKSAIGSGPAGEITRADLVPPAALQEIAGKVKEFEHGPSESLQSVPHFSLTVRCRQDELLALLTDLNAAIASRGVQISVDDMMIKAMAMALVEVPDANVEFDGEVWHHFEQVDLAIDRTTRDGMGEPVIRDAAALSLSALARKRQMFAEHARSGQLVSTDDARGTAASVSLGMLGIDEMIPALIPPKALALAVGPGVEMPWKVDDAIGLVTVAALTATFGKDAIDATAAAFMSALRRIVEAPRLLLL